MIINSEAFADKTISVAQLMQAPFSSGSLIIDFSQNRVSRDGETLVLQPKVLELLVILCAANGKTLSKQTLIDALWPDTVVGPDSLANTMTRLRKILNDDAKSPQFIKTVQRKGYLWLPNVVLMNETKKSINIKYPLVALSALLASALFYFFAQPEPEKFMFPDLSIKKLEDGGFEIEAGIEGELTEEKKAAMLKELKRITGEEYSDMEFTVDPVEPDCDDKKADGEESGCIKSKDKIH